MQEYLTLCLCFTTFDYINFTNNIPDATIKKKN